MVSEISTWSEVDFGVEVGELGETGLLGVFVYCDEFFSVFET